MKTHAIALLVATSAYGGAFAPSPAAEPTPPPEAAAAEASPTVLSTGNAPTSPPAAAAGGQPTIRSAAILPSSNGTKGKARINFFTEAYASCAEAYPSDKLAASVYEVPSASGTTQLAPFSYAASEKLFELFGASDAPPWTYGEAATGSIEIGALPVAGTAPVTIRLDDGRGTVVEGTFQALVCPTRGS